MLVPTFFKSANKSAVFNITVWVLVFGCTPINLFILRTSWSTISDTWWYRSLSKLKGDTIPGATPRIWFSSSGEANDNREVLTVWRKLFSLKRLFSGRTYRKYSFRSVSYTHLDVYKRQSIYPCRTVPRVWSLSVTSRVKISRPNITESCLNTGDLVAEKNANWALNGVALSLIHIYSNMHTCKSSTGLFHRFNFAWWF